MSHTTIILLAAAGLALAGCSNSGSAPKIDTKPSATQTTDPGDEFVTKVVDAHLDSYAAGVPAADELKAFPPEWCSALDDGHSVEWMFDIFEGGLYPVGETWGAEKADAYELLVMGVKTHCPKHSGAVLEELRASGEY